MIEVRSNEGVVNLRPVMGRKGRPGIDGIDGDPGVRFSRAPNGCLIMIAKVDPPPPVPGAPTDLVATPGRGKVDLIYTTPAGGDPTGPVTSYRARYRTVGSPSWTAGPSVSGTAMTINSLLNATQYEVQVQALNSSGAGPYTASVTFTPGAVNGVVASDDFTRTASDLVGTSPTVGLYPYAGATGQFEVDGSRMVGKSGASGGLATLNLGARGDITITGTLRLSTLTNAAATSLRYYIKWGDTSNYMYFDVGVSTAGAASISVKLNALNAGLVTFPTGFPGGTIPSTTAEADYPFVFTLNTDGSWSLTINGVTRSNTSGSSRALTATERGALAAITTVGFTAATGNSTNVKYDNVSYSVNGTYV